MRGLSHINLHTQALEEAKSFYISQCGLGISRDDGNANAAFLSSGSNHHEVEIFRDERPFVRHLGLEYDSPAELEACLQRLQRSAARIERLSLVPGLMQSVFCSDLEGNGLHLFANLTTDWRSWQKGDASQVETWVVDPSRTPDRTRYPADLLEVQRPPDTKHRALRFVGGGLAAAEPTVLRAFYVGVLGFEDVVQADGAFPVISHRANQLVIEPSGAGAGPGLAWVSFALSGLTFPDARRDPLGLRVHLLPDHPVD
jgi:catechol-2,3-dioxygenase